MHSVAQGIALMKSPAQRTRDGGSWSGWCQSFAFRFLGASRSADTAYLGYKMSGHVVSKDPTKARPGTVHWWSDGGPGHVAIAIGPGGLAAMASATAAKYGEKWGTDSGAITVEAYNQHHPNLTYLGWTWDFEGEYVPEVKKFLDDEAAKELAAAKAAKAAKEARAKADADALAKATADAIAAKEAAAVKAAADEQARVDAAIAAQPKAEANIRVLLVKEASRPDIYLLDGVTKVHLTRKQFDVYVILGVTYSVVPDGSLADFRTVNP